MKRFLILALANMIVFISFMIYGRWWYYNDKSLIVLVIFPLLFTVFVVLVNFFIRKNPPEKLNKYELNQLLGTMSGLAIGVSLIWFVIGLVN